MITLKSCPVCGSTVISPYHEAGFAPHILVEIMPSVKVDAAIIARYWVCQGCSVIFQNPRLSDSEINRFYATGLYMKMLNLTTEQKDADEMHRANTDAAIIKKQIGKVKSHLDIGCSRGYLLTKVKGSVRVGVEPKIDYVTAKGVKVYSKLNQVPQKAFDLVSAIHTLEHEPDPLNYLKKMAKFVGKEGFLVVEVPTWKSPGGPLRLAHLFHFEPDVLKLMCARIGLKVVDTEFTPHLVLICRLADI